MYKKSLILLLVGFLAMNLCGCMAAVMTFMAESAKAKQTLDITYSDAIDVVKGAMKVEGVKFKEATIKDNIAVAKGEYNDGRTVRIYIHKISDTQCDIAVRVGTSDAGRKDADKILKAILDYHELTSRSQEIK
jgi:hypothetical protein